MKSVVVPMRFSFGGVRLFYDESWTHRIEVVADSEQTDSAQIWDCIPAHVESIVAFLRSYERGQFEVPDIDAFQLKLACSEFAESIYRKLIEIPAGEIIRYGELAAAAGRPRAARAVGHAMHVNPFPIVIPCHRVVSVGNMWLYAYGEQMKRELLRHERCPIACD